MATRTVEVVDSTPPVLECVEEITLEAADNCGALSDVPIPTTSDNCSAPEAIVLQNDAPDSLPVGTTPVRWTARDEAGNEAECTILVVVEDRVAPTLTCPADIDIEADSRSGDTAVVTFEPTANDNCDPAPRVVCGPASGSTFGIGTTTVICTATDASGNEAVCSFSVTVRPAGGGQIPGDCNQDGAVNIADSLCVLGALFQGIPERLPCGDGTRLDVGNVALLDWNGGGTLDVSDPIAMLNWLFAGGPAHVLGQDCQPMRNCPDVCEI